MRIAAIDIGTNSIHLIVANVHPHSRYEIIESSKEMVRLGRGGLTEGVLMDDAQDRAIVALQRMMKLAAAKKVDQVVAVATSAVREASNGGEFLARIMDECGLRVQVIQGIEEARLIYMAVREAVDFGDHNVLIVDIGGGSVEFILANAKQALLLRSLKLGVARLREMFISKDPFPSRETRALAVHVGNQLAPLRKQIEAAGGFSMVIGTSGTILNVCALAEALRDGKKVGRSKASLEERSAKRRSNGRDGLLLERRALREVTKKLTSLSPRARERLPEYDIKRGDLAVVGACLLDEMFDALRISQLRSCDRALREGVILDFVDKHRPDLAIYEDEPDLRRRSVRSLMARYSVDTPHTELVAGFAAQVFDVTKPLHHLSLVDRELLEHAARLHDIGYHISAEAHHKHTHYLVTQSRLPGFTAVEQNIIGLIGRYHRKNKPKLEHSEFAGLLPTERNRVRILSAILKIADGLDRTHAGVVKKLTAQLNRRRLQIVLHSDVDCELEQWATLRNSEALSEQLGIEIAIDCKSMSKEAVRLAAVVKEKLNKSGKTKQQSKKKKS